MRFSANHRPRISSTRQTYLWVVWLDDPFHQEHRENCQRAVLALAYLKMKNCSRVIICLFETSFGVCNLINAALKLGDGIEWGKVGGWMRTYWQRKITGSCTRVIADVLLWNVNFKAPEQKVVTFRKKSYLKKKEKRTNAEYTKRISHPIWPY